jgi:hypothetical protein
MVVMLKSLIGILLLALIFKLAFSPEFAVYILVGLILLVCVLMLERIVQNRL